MVATERLVVAIIVVDVTIRENFEFSSNLMRARIGAASSDDASFVANTGEEGTVALESDSS